MARYQIITLIDITRSQPTKDDTDKIKIGQQANFNSLVQAIGLRSNIEWSSNPRPHDGRLPEPFKGRGTYWTWQFDCEREDVFLKHNDPVGLLLEDLHSVPIIPLLTNTIDINPAAFQTKGEGINTVVVML